MKKRASYQGFLQQPAWDKYGQGLTINLQELDMPSQEEVWKTIS
jgi:hypothetical protein